MRKLGFAIVGLAMAGLFTGSAWASDKGNGLPHGSKSGKYLLNVIAYDNCPAGDFTGSERHMIAVEADYDPFSSDLTGTQKGTSKFSIIKTNTIELRQSSDGKFHVVDGNACVSKGAARLELPITVANCDPCTVATPTFNEYLVFVRLVGNPNNGAGIGVTTCADPLAIDLTGIGFGADDIVCSTENVVVFRVSNPDDKRVAKFSDKTKELLTICLDTTGNFVCDTRLGLFDPALEDYFWQWNTKGRPHAQLVFIPVS